MAMRIVAAEASCQDSSNLGQRMLLWSCKIIYMKPKGVSLITKEVVATGVYQTSEKSPLLAPMCANAKRNDSASPSLP